MLPKSDIRVARSEFLRDPLQAIECKLVNVSTNDVHADKFHDIILGCRCCIRLGKNNISNFFFCSLNYIVCIVESKVGNALEVVLFDENECNINEWVSGRLSIIPQQSKVCARSDAE